MMVTPFHYLIVSLLLFTIGIMGMILRRNTLMILLCIELLFNGANLAFVAFSKIHGSLDGQVVALFVMATAACEVTVALAIAVLVFRDWKTINTEALNSLKG
jgi:NADH-quinone oxidoreductase subunit K